MMRIIKAGLMNHCVEVALMNEIMNTTISSVEVAEMIGKRHDNLLADIREYIKEFSLLNFKERDYFIVSTYKNRGKEYPCYDVTKKGCEFIAHKLTGIKGTEFTVKYIERFHDMEDTINGNYAISKLSPELQAIFVHDKKIQIVEQRVDKLENTMNIDYAQQKQLKNFANEVVVKALGGKEARAYRYRGDDGSKVSSQCFSRFWHDFNDYFNINAYANLPRVRFDEALEYVNRWQPPTNMQLEIGRINREIA